jgi:glucose/arabinose dehydrogenase
MDGNGAIGVETVLIDNIAAPGSNHNAGDLQFGKDGFLYVSVGDGGSTPDTARRLDTLNGKILRITRDGGIPVGNPFTGSETEPCRLHGGSPSGGKTCQEIYAAGLRNPFRIAFDHDDPSGQQFFINDVGGGAWEEINAGAPAADYGWNLREGPCGIGSTTNCPPPPPRLVDPIHAYQHQTGCRTITGGAFVPNSTSWPAGFHDDYLSADLACDTIFTLDVGSRAVAPFATGSGAIHLRFGSDGVLYYTTYEGTGQVRRIVAGSSVTLPPPADDETVPCKKNKDKKHKAKNGKHKHDKDKKNGCKKGKREGGGSKNGNHHRRPHR